MAKDHSDARKVKRDCALQITNVDVNETLEGWVKGSPRPVEGPSVRNSYHTKIYDAEMKAEIIVVDIRPFMDDLVFSCWRYEDCGGGAYYNGTGMSATYRTASQ